MKSISTILKLTEFVTATFSFKTLKKTKSTLLLLAVFLMGWNVSSGQTYYSMSGGNYSQTFNNKSAPNSHSIPSKRRQVAVELF